MEICMLATNLFMLWWGIKLVQTTWYQSIPDFPDRVGGPRLLPIPIGGALTTLLVMERFLPRTCSLSRTRDRQPTSERIRSSSAHGNRYPHRQSSRSSVYSACRSPTHSALPPFSRPCGSDLPLEAVMLKDLRRHGRFRAARYPFLHPGRCASWRSAAWRSVSSTLPRYSSASFAAALALVNILASTLFGCISGSSVADTAAVGSVMIPQMIKNGYPRLFAVNVTISGSLQPLLDPAIPQHDHLLDGGRRHDIGRAPVHRRHHSRRSCSVCPSSFSSSHRARNNFPKGEVIPLRRRSRSRWTRFGA